jgi:hypothetical protein
MTHEEMEKAMQFVVEQRAQFAADIQRLSEAQVDTNQLLNRLAAATVKGFEEHNARINALVDAQLRTEESLKETQESLRNLIAVVDRYFSEGRQQNGSSL